MQAALLASYEVRERAACSFTELGMFSLEQRQKAVPQLILLLQDSNLDPRMRKWTLMALREITREQLPDDTAAWTNWYDAQPH